MRAALAIIIPLLWAAALPAEEPAPTPPPKPAAEPAATESKPATEKPSAKVSEMLSAMLPKYSPPPPEEPAKPADPDVLVLEKRTVTQKKRPRLTDEAMMTNKAFNESLAKKNTSSLDRNVLNKFALPAWLGGQSAAQRAREEYEYQQRQELIKDVDTIARAAAVVDPEQAKALREAAAKP